MKININDIVELDLTPKGVDVLKQSKHYHKEYTDLNEGRLKEQMWVVMKIFGEHIFNGGDQLILNNIIEYVDKPCIP